MPTIAYSYKSSGGSASWSGFTQTPTSPATETLSSGIPQTTLPTNHKNTTASNSKFTISGTWTALFGVPAGGVITGVTSASAQSKCTTFTGGSGCSALASTLVDGATTITLSAARSFTATDASFVSSSGTDATGLALAASDTVTVTIANTLGNGNSNSDTVVLQQDNLVFTITYNLVLTQVSAAGSVGTISPQTTVLVSQDSAIGSIGAISPQVTVALSQVSTTGSVGTMASSSAKALSQVAGTGSVGSAAPGTSVSLTQDSTTVSVGSITPSSATSLSQVSSIGSVGSMNPVIALALSGVSVAGSIGIATANTSVLLIQVVAVSSIGDLTPSTGGSDVTVQLVGVTCVGSLGALTASVFIPPRSPIGPYIFSMPSNRGFTLPLFIAPVNVPGTTLFFSLGDAGYVNPDGLCLWITRPDGSSYAVSQAFYIGGVDVLGVGSTRITFPANTYIVYTFDDDEINMPGLWRVQMGGGGVLSDPGYFQASG